MKINFTIILFVLLCVGTKLYSQQVVTHVNSKTLAKGEELTVAISETKNDTVMMRILLENAPTVFNAPGLPRFAIVGREHKFYLGLGGYAKGTLSYDFGNPITNGAEFITSQIPMNQLPGNGRLVQMNAQTSNLFINFVGMPGTKNQIGAYINVNALGPDYGLYLMYAYLKYRGFTVGYNFSLFADLAASPPTIDFEGPNSFTLVQNSVIDYEHTIGKRWSFGLGLEMPMASATTSSQTYMVNQRMPDIPLYMQYSWNKGANWLRFSGIVRSLLYRDVESSVNRANTGWGVKLSGMANISKKLTTFYQAVYGQGISNYMQDINGLGLDMTPNMRRDGYLSNVESWGGYLGAQYNFTKTTFMSCTYSMVKTNVIDQYYNADMYKSAQYVVANLFWNLAPNVQMGVEYLWGERTNIDNRFRSNTRIQTMIQVNF